MKKHLLLLSMAASAVLADSFTLGQVNVLNTPIEESPFEQTMTADTIAQQNTENITDALENMSGLSTQFTGGGRNETSISIRGQDSKRVGLFIDGVPAYVPYDGFVDYDRFLTSDIAEIDVAKGFSSVAYGSNTLGGVINIITKRPTKAFEGEIKGGMVFDSDTALSRRITSLNIGTRQDHIYAQLGAAYSDQNHFRLSDDYVPSSGATLQKAGDRLRSATKDQKINFKTGYIADDGSEIAIGYNNQKGQKEVPPSTTSTSWSGKDRWTWPYWDKETLYISGQKNLSEGFIKSTVYYDKSQNSLDYNYMLVDNKSGTSFNNTGASRYDDYSYGARLEYGVQLNDHFVTASTNYKNDVHRGYQINEVQGSEYISEKFEDHTISFGLEDIYAISSRWQLVAGMGYDRKVGDFAYDTTPNGLVPTPVSPALSLGTQDALNPEIAAIYTLDPTSKIRASIAQKTYLPSMKDRYSRKLGTALPNPDLDAEKATHYELSYQKQFGILSSKIVGFYTHVNNAIQSVIIDDKGTVTTADDVSQNQNIGTIDRKGIELDLAYKGEFYELGGNYSYLSFKNKTGTTPLTDVPKHEVFSYAQVDMGYGFSVFGDMKVRKGAIESISNVYSTLPTFTTYDLKTLYKATEHVTAEAGIKNLTDKLVIYNYGYPNAGREFFANLSYKF